MLSDSQSGSWVMNPRVRMKGAVKTLFELGLENVGLFLRACIGELGENLPGSRGRINQGM